MKVVAVMPAYNEEKRIGAAISGVRGFVDAVVVVDDCSRDATYSVAKNSGVYTLRHTLNRGQGAALKTGSAAALMLGADIVIHIDADGQHDPSFIPALIQPIVRGESDIVLGSRFMGVASTGMPLTRRVLMFGIKRFNSLALGIPQTLTDPQSGLRAMTRGSFEVVTWRQDRMAHCSEILRSVVRSGLRYSEVPAKVRYTRETIAKGQEGANAVVAVSKIVWQLLLGGFQK